MNIMKPEGQERAVIGILAGGVAQDVSAIRVLSPEDFSDRTAARVFAAYLRLMEQHKAVTFEALDEQLTREHGAEQAAELMQTVMESAREHRLGGWQLPETVRIVCEGAKRRALVQIGEAIVRGAADERRDVSELIDRARNTLRESAGNPGTSVTLADAMDMTCKAMERREAPISTGVPMLDRILCGGLHKGEMTVLGARPAVGKSAVLLHMAIAAARAGKHVVFVSLEMSAEQIGVRALSTVSDVNAGRLRFGDIPQRVWTQLADGLMAYGDAAQRLHIIARGGVSVEELTSEVVGMHDGGLCDVLVVDYLQLLRTRQKTGNDFERLGIVSRALKAITLDLGIPVLTAAQVRRQNNGGVLRMPGLDELRGSGDIEQDADNVILLHKPESPDDGAFRHAEDVCAWERARNAGKQLMLFNVAKQRQGMTACAWSEFDPSRMRFESPEESQKGEESSES